MTRRYHHLHSGRLGSEVLLGPDLRALRMAKAAADAGMESKLVVAEACGTAPEGVGIDTLERFRLDRLRRGDAVVLSESIAARIPFLLARRGIPFHVDLYGLPPAELVQVYPDWSPDARRIDRARRTLRLQFAVLHAERIYLSHPGQLPMLAGIAFAGSQVSLPESIFSLSERVSYLPVGAPVLGKPADNPYPPAIRHRPVFLFGGGIWPWLDNETLIRSFHKAASEGSSAALFFLSGQDRSGSGVLEKSAADARALSDALGATGRSVFFNEREAGAAELPSYLHHCAAGAMAEPATLESQTCWRTRYLDLLAAGRPLVLAGNDPLGDMMSLSGCALSSPCGDVDALAHSVKRLSEDTGLARTMGDAALALSRRMSWDSVMERYVRILASPESFRSVRRPGLLWPIRYALAPQFARWD